MQGHTPVSTDHQIVWLQIAVHDTLAVHMPEDSCDVARVEPRVGFRKGATELEVLLKGT